MPGRPSYGHVAMHRRHAHTRIETSSSFSGSTLEPCPGSSASPCANARPLVPCGSPRRAVPAGNQVTHTFLESPPFLADPAARTGLREMFRNRVDNCPTPNDACTGWKDVFGQPVYLCTLALSGGYCPTVCCNRWPAGRPMMPPCQGRFRHSPRQRASTSLHRFRLLPLNAGRITSRIFTWMPLRRRLNSGCGTGVCTRRYGPQSYYQR
jgi:hypothetical protein